MGGCCGSEEKLPPGENSKIDVHQHCKQQLEHEIQRVTQIHQNELQRATQHNNQLQREIADLSNKVAGLSTELERKDKIIAGQEIQIARQSIESSSRVSSYGSPASNVSYSTSSPPVHSPSASSLYPPPSSSPPKTFVPPVALPAPMKVPLFFTKSVADLPDIVDLLNDDAANRDPRCSFHLVDGSFTGSSTKKLAIVLAICGTDRVDVTDRELVDNVRNDKGYENVLLVVLRRGNDPSKFKANNDPSMNSGVGDQKAILQFVYFKGHVLMEADSNQSNMALLFKLVQKAFY